MLPGLWLFILRLFSSTKAMIRTRVRLLRCPRGALSISSSRRWKTFRANLHNVMSRLNLKFTFTRVPNIRRSFLTCWSSFLDRHAQWHNNSASDSSSRNRGDRKGRSPSDSTIIVCIIVHANVEFRVPPRISIEFAPRWTGKLISLVTVGSCFRYLSIILHCTPYVTYACFDCSCVRRFVPTVPGISRSRSRYRLTTLSIAKIF